MSTTAMASQRSSDGAAGRPFVPALVVVAALREELRPLLRRIRGRVDDRDGLCVRGFLGRLPVLLASTGAGVRNAERGVGALLRVAPQEAPVLGIGVAGALSPGLAAGDLVIGASVREGSTTRVAPTDWVGWARRAGARPGTVATVDAVIARAEHKRELWEDLGRPEVAVVDMESARWAASAAATGRPFLVVRSVSDEAGEELPAYLEVCRDASGGVDRGRVVRRALAQPSSLASLLRLRRRVLACADGLAHFVVRLLEELSTERPASPQPGPSELVEAS